MGLGRVDADDVGLEAAGQRMGECQSCMYPGAGAGDLRRLALLTTTLLARIPQRTRYLQRLLDMATFCQGEGGAARYLYTCVRFHALAGCKGRDRERTCRLQLAVPHMSCGDAIAR